jgi:putative NADH-flavin reductase
MKVLVIGASGPLGKQIVSTALERGHQVTAFVRRGFDMQQLIHHPMQHPKLDIAIGDAMDSETLDRPMAGKEAVICSLGMKPIDNEVELFSEGTSNIVRCMTRHNTRRLICVTGIGAGESVGHGGAWSNRILQSPGLQKIYEDKTRQEELIRYCNRDWIVVRPAQLTDGPLRGRYAMLKEVRGVQTSSISRMDVAAFCADQLVSNKFLYQFVALTDE